MEFPFFFKRALLYQACRIAKSDSYSGVSTSLPKKQDGLIVRAIKGVSPSMYLYQIWIHFSLFLVYVCASC